MGHGLYPLRWRTPGRSCPHAVQRQHRDIQQQRHGRPSQVSLGHGKNLQVLPDARVHLRGGCSSLRQETKVKKIHKYNTTNTGVQIPHTGVQILKN